VPEVLMAEFVRHDEGKGVVVQETEQAGTDLDPPASVGGP
jgi:hypothetical protein